MPQATLRTERLELVPLADEHLDLEVEPHDPTLETLGMHFVRGFHEDYDEPVPGSEHGEVEYELRRTDQPPRQTTPP